MTAVDTAPSRTISTDCAACGIRLRDEVDARTGLNAECRAALNYRHISALTNEQRVEANGYIHAIAQNKLRGQELQTAVFRLYEFGFQEMAKRIERRVGRHAIEVPVAPEPELHPAQEPIPVDNLPPLRFNPTPHQEATALSTIRRMMAKSGHAVAVVVGYAGTGKTACISFIAHEFGRPIIVTPTGKAALRVREATGLHASTIHRWIYTPVEDERTGATKFVRRTSDEIEAMIPRSRLVVLDEASMVGPDVWNDIRSVCEQHEIKLVCIGDGFQLPPVQGPNAPPFSILSREFSQQLNAERAEMTEVLRQAQDSPIIRASMALRAGGAWSSLKELHQIQHQEIANTCVAVHQRGGVTICHRNVTRFQLNAGIRQMLGIIDEMPQRGEPLMVLKNAYDIGVVNGETIPFPGWAIEPEQPERVYDRYKPVEESARFGGIVIQRDDAEGKVLRATIAIEELHGRLTAGPKFIGIAAAKWARLVELYSGDSLAPHCHANFGYAYTAHKSQGSQWPFVFVLVERSVRIEEEDGRRWVYTAITRASEACAVFSGNL